MELHRPQTLQTIVISLGCLLELERKTLLLKQHKLESYNKGNSIWYSTGSFILNWLSFLVLEGTVPSKGGEK